MLSGISGDYQSLEDKIQFHITQLDNYKNLFKQFYKKVQDNPSLRGQFELWQASRLRLSLTSSDKENASASPLAADDFLTWHQSLQEVIYHYQQYLLELADFIKTNDIMLDMNEITNTTTQDKYYFPVYQMLYEQHLQEAQEKLDMLHAKKKKLKEINYADSESDYFYYHLYEILTSMRIGIPLLVTHGVTHFSNFISLQLANYGIDQEIMKTEQELAKQSSEFKQEFKRITQLSNEKVYNSRIALSQFLFKAQKHKNKCNQKVVNLSSNFSSKRI